MNIKAKVFKRETAIPSIKGVATLTIDDCFIIKGITIMNGKNGLFVSMPNRKSANGEYKDICYPLNAETRKQITDLILEEYNKLDADNQDELDITSPDLPF